MTSIRQAKKERKKLIAQYPDHPLIVKFYQMAEAAPGIWTKQAAENKFKPVARKIKTQQAVDNFAKKHPILAEFTEARSITDIPENKRAAYRKKTGQYNRLVLDAQIARLY